MIIANCSVAAILYPPPTTLYPHHMPIRDTFWNIPQWAEFPQYILGLLAGVVLVYGVWLRVQVWRRGKPAPITGSPGERLQGALQHALLQARTLSQPYPGVMHLSIFWGISRSAANPSCRASSTVARTQ